MKRQLWVSLSVTTALIAAGCGAHSTPPQAPTGSDAARKGAPTRGMDTGTSNPIVAGSISGTACYGGNPEPTVPWTCYIMPGDSVSFPVVTVRPYPFNNFTCTLANWTIGYALQTQPVAGLDVSINGNPSPSESCYRKTLELTTTSPIISSIGQKS